MYSLTMQAISFTQLRTEPRKLKRLLEEGKSIDLIHRSKVVGEIKPKVFDPEPFDPEKFAKVVKKLNLPKLSGREIERRYRKVMMEKHGQTIPRY